MQIKKISPENLIEYSFNNRNHSDDQIDLIANSIKEFGFNQPIVVDEDNIILVGHGRLKAAKKLGLTEVPYLQILGLDETKKKAYRILDNKIQNDSTWNFESLNIELPALEADGFDLQTWGLDKLLITVPDFSPAGEDEQGKLDELDPKMVKCPSCEHTFDSRDHEIKA